MPTQVWWHPTRCYKHWPHPPEPKFSAAHTDMTRKRLECTVQPVAGLVVWSTSAMPYKSMSLEEFARHVNMDAREVRRLADRDKLPGTKVGGQWRFNRAKVTEWLQQEMHTLDEQRLVALEHAMGGTTPSGAKPSASVITDLIGQDGIDVALAARTKASVLRELVKLANRTGLLYDEKGLLEAIQQREALCSTALPGGVAIPHARQPMQYVSAEPLICVARPTSGIVFGAPKGELTRIFFLICCHDDRHHLHVLARLMRILNNGAVDELCEAETAEQLLGILAEREQKTAAET